MTRRKLVLLVFLAALTLANIFLARLVSKHAGASKPQQSTLKRTNQIPPDKPHPQHKTRPSALKVVKVPFIHPVQHLIDAGAFDPVPDATPPGGDPFLPPGVTLDPEENQKQDSLPPYMTSDLAMLFPESRNPDLEPGNTKNVINDDALVLRRNFVNEARYDLNSNSNKNDNYNSFDNSNSNNNIKLPARDIHDQGTQQLHMEGGDTYDKNPLAFNPHNADNFPIPYFRNDGDVISASDNTVVRNFHQAGSNNYNHNNNQKQTDNPAYRIQPGPVLSNDEDNRATPSIFGGDDNKLPFGVDSILDNVRVPVAPHDAARDDDKSATSWADISHVISNVNKAPDMTGDALRDVIGQLIHDDSSSNQAKSPQGAFSISEKDKKMLYKKLVKELINSDNGIDSISGNNNNNNDNNKFYLGNSRNKMNNFMNDTKVNSIKTRYQQIQNSPNAQPSRSHLQSQSQPIETLKQQLGVYKTMMGNIADENGVDPKSQEGEMLSEVLRKVEEVIGSGKERLSGL